MGAEGPTLPTLTPALSVRSTRVDVIEGPDAPQTMRSRGERIAIGSAQTNDLVLADPTVSRFHAEIQGISGGIAIRDLGSTNGTWAGGVRILEGVVPPGTVVTLGRTQLRVGADRDEVVPLYGQAALAGVLGRSAVMRRLMAQVQRLASSESSVLLIGESGTGKEVVARALCSLGARAKRPFVTFDCGSVTPSLINAELFGYEKGAFTGAENKRTGAFEAADGGTLFLDEIGELPLAVQSSLLGALERRRFRRIGGRDEVAVDVRVVAATHRDLRSDVNAGRFRSDLYFRLAVVTLDLPPLRDRLEDLPLLVEHFVREAGHDGSVEEAFSPEVLDALAQYHWPGNVRELRNWVEASLATGAPQTPWIAPAPASARNSVPASVPPAPAPVESAATTGDAIERVLERPWKEARQAVLTELEQRYLSALLERAKGNLTQASKLARTDRTYLVELVRRHQRHEPEG